jgi:hypothetical protein
LTEFAIERNTQTCTKNKIKPGRGARTNSNGEKEEGAKNSKAKGNTLTEKNLANQEQNLLAIETSNYKRRRTREGYSLTCLVYDYNRAAQREEGVYSCPVTRPETERTEAKSNKFTRKKKSKQSSRLTWLISCRYLYDLSF